MNRYLVDVRWMKQWKKYVGYDQWDQSLAGQESACPGPVDNSNLFKGLPWFPALWHIIIIIIIIIIILDFTTGALKEHLMEELDYFLLPESAWNKLSSWYSVSEGSRPIFR